MSQSFGPERAGPAIMEPAVTGPARSGRMAGLAASVRTLTADLLGATDTRIIRIAPDDKGWWVDAEVFAPNPELTVNLHGGSKAILERSRYRFHLDHELQLISLDMAEG